MADAPFFPRSLIQTEERMMLTLEKQAKQRALREQLDLQLKASSAVPNGIGGGTHGGIDHSSARAPGGGGGGSRVPLSGAERHRARLEEERRQQQEAQEREQNDKALMMQRSRVLQQQQQMNMSGLPSNASANATQSPHRGNKSVAFSNQLPTTMGVSNSGGAGAVGGFLSLPQIGGAGGGGGISHNFLPSVSRGAAGTTTTVAPPSAGAGFTFAMPPSSLHFPDSTPSSINSLMPPNSGRGAGAGAPVVMAGLPAVADHQLLGNGDPRASVTMSQRDLIHLIQNATHQIVEQRLKAVGVAPSSATAPGDESIYNVGQPHTPPFAPPPPPTATAMTSGILRTGGQRTSVRGGAKQQQQQQGTSGATTGLVISGLAPGAQNNNHTGNARGAVVRATSRQPMDRNVRASRGGIVHENTSGVGLADATSSVAGTPTGAVAKRMQQLERDLQNQMLMVEKLKQREKTWEGQVQHLQQDLKSAKIKEKHLTRAQMQQQQNLLQQQQNLQQYEDNMRPQRAETAPMRASSKQAKTHQQQQQATPSQPVMVKPSPRMQLDPMSNNNNNNNNNNNLPPIQYHSAPKSRPVRPNHAIGQQQQQHQPQKVVVSPSKQRIAGGGGAVGRVTNLPALLPLGAGAGKSNNHNIPNRPPSQNPPPVRGPGASAAVVAPVAVVVGSSSVPRHNNHHNNHHQHHQQLLSSPTAKLIEKQVKNPRLDAAVKLRPSMSAPELYSGARAGGGDDNDSGCVPPLTQDDDDGDDDNNNDMREESIYSVMSVKGSAMGRAAAAAAGRGRGASKSNSNVSSVKSGGTQSAASSTKNANNYSLRSSYGLGSGIHTATCTMTFEDLAMFAESEVITQEQATALWDHFVSEAADNLQQRTLLYDEEDVAVDQFERDDEAEMLLQQQQQQQQHDREVPVYDPSNYLPTAEPYSAANSPKNLKKQQLQQQKQSSMKKAGVSETPPPMLSSLDPEMLRQHNREQRHHPPVNVDDNNNNDADQLQQRPVSASQAASSDRESYQTTPARNHSSTNLGSNKSSKNVSPVQQQHFVVRASPTDEVADIPHQHQYHGGHHSHHHHHHHSHHQRMATMSREERPGAAAGMPPQTPPLSTVDTFDMPMQEEPVTANVLRRESFRESHLAGEEDNNNKDSRLAGGEEEEEDGDEDVEEADRADDNDDDDARENGDVIQDGEGAADEEEEEEELSSVASDQEEAEEEDKSFEENDE